jgi:hypothetical protein
VRFSGGRTACKRECIVRTWAEHRYVVPGSSLSSGVSAFGSEAGLGGTRVDWTPPSVDSRNEGVRGSNPRVGSTKRPVFAGLFVFS